MLNIFMFDLFMYQLDHVKVMLETEAVSQEVCLGVLFKKLRSLKHALYVNLSSSHSHKNCLFFLVSGRRLYNLIFTMGSHMMMFCQDPDQVLQLFFHQLTF